MLAATNTDVFGRKLGHLETKRCVFRQTSGVFITTKTSSLPSVEPLDVFDNGPSNRSG